MKNVYIQIGPKDCSYEKKYGFRPEEPSIDELIECYVQKHFPKGYVIVEIVRMPPHRGHPYTNSPDWFEYSIYGPFKTEKDLLVILERARESVKNGLVFKNGIRVSQDPQFKVTTETPKGDKE